MHLPLRKVILIIGLCSSSLLVLSQRQFDPKKRIEREKEQVQANITDLTEDQKIVLNQIYEDYSKEFIDIRSKSNGDFQIMRSNIQVIREKKDSMVKDLLTATQYSTYDSLMKVRQKRRQRPGPNK